mgnify:CR=1 FL=1
MGNIYPYYENKFDYDTEIKIYIVKMKDQRICAGG